MPHIVRAFPLRGFVTDLQAFAKALAGQRSGDVARFYRHYGVERESWHLQHIDHGPWVIAVTELADPTEAAPRYADAIEAFPLWFKSQVAALTGIDPNVAPLRPPTREIFAWSNRNDATQVQPASAT